jgi:nucleoside-diphosphate-sugar epimerase
MKVGVLGSSGMIGRHLVNLCVEQGDEIRVARRTPNLSRYHLDLVSRSGCPSTFFEGLDVVSNCAGMIDGEDLYKVNVDGVEWLAREAEQFDLTWVQLSSAGIYAQDGSGVIDEKSSPLPRSDYEKSKMYADQILGSTLIHSVFVRPTTVLGRDMRSRWSSKLVRSIVNNRFCYIGSREGTINAVGAYDVARAMALLAKEHDDPSASYLINNPCSIQYFVDRVVSAFRLKQSNYPVVPFAVAKALALTPFMSKLTGLTEDAVTFLAGRSRFDPTLFVDKYRFHYDSDPAELAIELYREGI